MCTAISLLHYFGRNLDLERSYCEKVVITPRHYPIRMRCTQSLDSHYAMIGMAAIAENYPLYYDATNEQGLSMAGLNFPGNAKYFPLSSYQENICPFELIPWILGQCKSVPEARQLLKNTRLVGIPFSKELPLTPLHWLLADPEQSVVVESTDKGLSLYDNPIGVLTNNPPFPYHLQNLCNYKGLSTTDAENLFCKSIFLESYSRGMGAIGLPGDSSSASRFIRAAFTKLNANIPASTQEQITQFFHILDNVAMVEGCVLHEGSFEKTAYSSCCDSQNRIYYYTTYENRQITGIPMRPGDMNAMELIVYPLIKQQQIHYENSKGLC